MKMTFNFEDLEQFPLQKESSGKRPAPYVKISARGLYFSSTISKRMKLKPHQKIDLRIVPNRKTIVIKTSGGPFRLARGASPTDASVRLNGKKIGAKLKEIFGETCWLTYKRIDADMYLLYAAGERGKYDIDE